MQKLASQIREPVPVQVTPALAGWRFLSFAVHACPAAGAVAGETGDEEACLVLLGGSGTLQIGTLRREIQGRAHVFAGLPHFGYVPRRTAWRFEAATAAELAVGSAPAEQDHPARILGPGDIRVELRGGRNVTRQISHLIDPGFGCQRLLCVEVYTPSGNWSSYPPHKHDTYDPPREVQLDEVYYYRMPADGFAIQRLYGKGHDDLLLCRDRDLVLVREGYHPVVAGPGYDVYYLNVLAGDHPSWAASDDPELAWVRQAWNSREPLSIPMTP